MAWDGKQTAAMAVQARYEEMVVSPQGLRDRLASRMAAFRGQLEQNRQDFLIKFGQTLPTAGLPDALALELRARLQRIQATQSALFQPLSAKLAVATIVNTSLLIFSQPIAERIIARLPGRLAPAALLKGMKATVFSILIFTGIDAALSRTVRAEMIEAIDTRMQQSERSIQSAVKHEADLLIQRSEDDLEAQVQETIHAEVIK